MGDGFQLEHWLMSDDIFRFCQVNERTFDVPFIQVDCAFEHKFSFSGQVYVHSLPPHDFQRL